MHGQAWGATIAPAAATMRAPPWHGSLTSAARTPADGGNGEKRERNRTGNGREGGRKQRSPVVGGTGSSWRRKPRTAGTTRRTKTTNEKEITLI